MKPFFFIIMLLATSAWCFPYQNAEWRLYGKMIRYCYPQEALTDLTYFITTQNPGVKRLGLTKFNRQSPKGVVFLDGTIEAGITGEIVFSSSEILDLTSLDSAHDIPHDKKRRAETIQKYRLDGFVELELSEAGEITQEYLWFGTNYRYISIKKYLKCILKIYDQKGEIVFFDFVDPGYQKDLYYEVKETSSFDSQMLNYVQLESKESYFSDKSRDSDKSIWDSSEK
ncbi:MAG: hypothetical protein PHW04_02080 [Candidatus Wallbacteria bacterium]|nr:hypothetical protein [Candidatus Wallbacteria bacterium]